MTQTIDKIGIFQKEVRKAFNFLDSKHGFAVRSSQPVATSSVISYESDKVYVNVYFGPPEYQVDFAFGRRGIEDGKDGHSFHVGDLLQLDACKSWAWKSNSGDSLVVTVHEYARLLEFCGSAVLLGDPAVFGEMKSRRDAAVAAWRENEETTRLKSAADDAWARKDYESVAKFYRRIVSNLTQSELKKLEYCDREAQRRRMTHK
jgi:hypothetical protein